MYHPHSLERQADRIDQLHASKQDAATAVTAQDVNSAMAQAVAHADARVGNLLRAVASESLLLWWVGAAQGQRCERAGGGTHARCHPFTLVTTSELSVQTPGGAKDPHYHCCCLLCAAMDSQPWMRCVCKWREHVSWWNERHPEVQGVQHVGNIWTCDHLLRRVLCTSGPQRFRTQEEPLVCVDACLYLSPSLMMGPLFLATPSQA